MSNIQRYITVFLREEFLPEEKRYLIKYLNNHYDYCYLDSRHFFNSYESVRMIITGSSHSLDALNAEDICLPSLNFSMHTQDLYYDYLNAKRAITCNKSIDTCVITLGYYSLYYDLSKTTYNYRCYDVYSPLLNDLHNAPFIEGLGFENNDEYLAFSRGYFQKYPNYYGPAVLSKHTNGEIRKLGGWSELNNSERLDRAKVRAEKHNKNRKYTETFEENKEILLQYIEMCAENNIRAVVAIMPFTTEYNRFISSSYKAEILAFLDQIEYVVDFIDFNDLDIWDIEDFIDSDHTSDIGADKVTHLLNDFL